MDIRSWPLAVLGKIRNELGPFTAAALIGAVPMVIFFLVLQDYIVGGFDTGRVERVTPKLVRFVMRAS